MDLSKLKQVTSSKKSSNKFKGLKVVKTDSNIKRKKDTIKKIPHTVLCEVFFVSGEYCVFINSQKYVISITKKDYTKAEFAFTTDKHPNYKTGLLFPFEVDINSINYVEDYWNLVRENRYVYVYVVNDHVKIDFEKTNKYNAEIWSEIEKRIKNVNKSNQKFYCGNARLNGVLKAKPL